MIIIKRVIAVTVLVLAVLGLLLMLGGVVGSWALNDTVTQIGVEVFNAGADFVGVTLDAGTRIETLLTNAQTLVTGVEGEIARVGTDLTQTNILDEIAERLGTDMESIITDIELFLGSIQKTVLVLANTLDAIRSLPLASDTAQVDQNIFRDAATDIDALSGEIDSIVALVERGKNKLTAQIVTDLTTSTTQLNTTIGALLVQMGESNAKLVTLQTDLMDAQPGWVRLVDIISIVLTIVFLFVALAFLSLALHAWAYFVKPSHTLRSLIPLEARSHSAMPTP